MDPANRLLTPPLRPRPFLRLRGCSCADWGREGQGFLPGDSSLPSDLSSEFSSRCGALLLLPFARAGGGASPPTRPEVRKNKLLYRTNTAYLSAEPWLRGPPIVLRRLRFGCVHPDCAAVRWEVRRPDSALGCSCSRSPNARHASRTGLAPGVQHLLQA